MKEDISQKNYEKISRIFSIMAHPIRLTILNRMLERDEMSVESMIKEFGLPKANVSQHLAELRRTSFVKSRRLGRHQIYRLGHPDIGELCRILHHICDSKKYKL